MFCFWCDRAYAQSHNMDQAALRLAGAFEEKSDKHLQSRSDGSLNVVCVQQDWKGTQCSM